MQNPLLQPSGLPEFDKIRPEHIEPALQHILQHNREQLAALLQANPNYTWNNLIQPLEDMHLALNQMWALVAHLHGVVNTPALRAAYQKCLPLLTAYHTELGQNEALFKAYQNVHQAAEFTQLNTAQQKVITDALRDFKLAGVALPEQAKARFKQMQQELADLSNQFEQNLLDATDQWQKNVEDKILLQGLPEHALMAAAETAKQKGKTGYLLTLQFPCYHAVITYADKRELRQEIYTAYTTRASDQGPHAGQWNNSKVMVEILKLRHAEAQLLDFKNYAELSLATKMAQTPQEIFEFLQQLAEHAKPVAVKEWQELQQFARDTAGITDLQAWDVAYCSEKLRQHKYAISQEELRPYFPVEKVLQGLFQITHKLYGVSILEKAMPVNIWHKDVRYFEIFDANKQLLAGFYLDLYAREHKRGGAWMAECKERHRNAQGQLNFPIAFIVCNLAAPTQTVPALFSHDEVVTLFHEFGHSLHHMLTQIETVSVSGINGVEWDAVELPSQFMENWCWQPEAVPLFSAHYQTKEALPNDLLRKLIQAKNFQSGMQLLRQIEFALFDFRLHAEFDPQNPDKIQTILNEIRKQIAVVPVPVFNRFQHGFAHIFAGGYAAGYYSYKWAEVLSSDAFTRFEEEGIFNATTGQDFLQHILTKGGSEKAMDLYIAFRKRKPTIDALLRHSGIQ